MAAIGQFSSPGIGQILSFKQYNIGGEKSSQPLRADTTKNKYLGYSMVFVIRNAVENDAEIIHGFILALASHTNSQRYVLTDVETLKEHGFGEGRKFGTLLAEVDGAAIGYLSYQWDYSIWAGSHFMFVQNIYVSEGHRRSGVGAALMKEAKTICKTNGCSHMKWEIDTDNSSAIEFYENTGATVAHRRIGSCIVE